MGLSIGFARPRPRNQSQPKNRHTGSVRRMQPSYTPSFSACFDGPGGPLGRWQCRQMPDGKIVCVVGCG